MDFSFLAEVTITWSQMSGTAHQVKRRHILKGMDTTTISLLIYGLFTDVLSSLKYIAPKQEASEIN
jgi:hypothetical protein